MANSKRLRAIKFDLAVMRFSARFSREIRAEKNRYIDAQISAWKRTRGFSALEETKHGENMAKIFNDNYKRIVQAAIKFTPQTITGIKSHLFLEYKFDEKDYEDVLFAYYSQYGGARAKDTAVTTSQDIRRALLEAFEAGEPESVVLREALKAKGLSAWRADTIARTETHIAANFANLYTTKKMADEIGVKLEKAWVPAIDDRTREAHADMDANNYIPEDDYFKVARANGGWDMMKSPGDPAGSAGNIINCRCYLDHRVAD